jgi:hypothetical protein
MMPVLLMTNQAIHTSRDIHSRLPLGCSLSMIVSARMLKKKEIKTLAE